MSLDVLNPDPISPPTAVSKELKPLQSFTKASVLSLEEQLIKWAMLKYISCLCLSFCQNNEMKQ